jgi:hypothetical protein
MFNSKLSKMKYFLIIAFTIMLFSCKHDRLDINVSDIDVHLNINRLENLIFVKDSSTLSINLEIIKNNQDGFFDIYTEHVLKIGTFEDSGFKNYLNSFVSDTVISRVADSVKHVFGDFHKIEKQLTIGFKHYKYYFPNALIPEIFTCVTGFNQSIIISDYGIGIGLDKYLGSDCIFYKYLGIPQYKSANMHKGKIVPDVFYSLFISDFPSHDSIDNLLSNMIYQGKAIYFTKAMCPGLPDSIIMGYSSKQLKWCIQNEEKMWAYLVENKLLYDFERLTQQKYVGDAPFTNTFAKESPGRTGSWLGLRIIQSFMNKNPKVTLNELVQTNNAQSILIRSGYFPE